MVNGKNDLDTLLCCLGKESLCSINVIGLEEGLADLFAENAEECLSHTAADDDGVTCLYERLKNSDLA